MALGKGLESLIPPKRGDTGGLGDSGSPVSPAVHQSGPASDISAAPFTIHEEPIEDTPQDIVPPLASPVSGGHALPVSPPPPPTPPASYNPSVIPHSMRDPASPSLGGLNRGESLGESPNSFIQSIPPSPPKSDEPFGSTHGKQSVFHIEVEKIRPNPHQPRREFDEAALRELASSIREFGVIQPLVVTKVITDSEYGSDVLYELIAGERRLMASKLAGLRTVPVVVRRASTDREKLEVAIIENIQRRDLNPIEQAKAFARLQDEFKLTQREIGARLGKSREAVANSVRLLQLPQDIQESVASGKLSESQARLLLSLNDIGEQKRMFDEISGSKMSVREIKTKIERVKMEKAGGGATHADPETSALRERLEEFLGTKVDLKDEGNSGSIKINFYSKEELQGILDKMFGGNQI